MIQTLSSYNQLRINQQICKKTSSVVHFHSLEKGFSKYNVKRNILQYALRTYPGSYITKHFSFCNYQVGNRHFCIALAQTLTSSDRCLVLQVCVLPTQQPRHYLRCLLAYSSSYLTTSSSLAALWRAGPLCCLSLSYHTLSCKNSAFVMAVISLLCFPGRIKMKFYSQSLCSYLQDIKKRKRNMLDFEEVK